MALSVPNSPNVRTIQYTNLLGCDFSQDASLVDRRHSPDMLNMISDEGGNPVKRKGWEILYELPEDSQSEITNIWTFKEDGHDYCVVEMGSGSALKQFDLETKTLVDVSYGTETRPNAPISIAFYNDNAKDHGFYLITSSATLGHLKFAKLTPYENESHQMRLRFKWVDPYVPTTIIARPPNGQGGTAYEAINLLTTKRAEQFIVTGSAANEFHLGNPAQEIYPVEKIEVLNAQGEWVTYEGDYWFNPDDRRQMRVNPAIGVTPSGGADNVRVTYYPNTSSSTAISKCTQQAFFSQGSAESVFVTGNPDEPQKIWYSTLGDISYFPDTNYLYLGGDGGECMGFLPVQGNLAILKKNQENGHATTYLIYPTTISSTSVELIDPVTGEQKTKTEEEYVYATKTIPTSVGAVSKNGFGVLGDEPLFLSPQGLYGITSLNQTEDKAVTNRSWSVDRKLTAEDLSDAQVLVQNNYLYVFVNNHVYVFDGRHKTGDVRNNTNYFYEAYYWENVPAKKVCSLNDTIYFINDSQLCRFKNTGDVTDYSDGSYYDNGTLIYGDPIRAVWSTKNDDDGMPQYFKTLQKKGSMCTIAPYSITSVDAWGIVDGEMPIAPSVADVYDFHDVNFDEIGFEQDTRLLNKAYIGKYIGGIFNFANIDFSKFILDGRNGPKDYFFKKKRKKYIRLQLVFENNEVNEPFGILSVTKSFVATRYAKGR